MELACLLAKRDGLTSKTAAGGVAGLCGFPDGFFDFVFHQARCLQRSVQNDMRRIGRFNLFSHGKSQVGYVDARE